MNPGDATSMLSATRIGALEGTTNQKLDREYMVKTELDETSIPASAAISMLHGESRDSKVVGGCYKCNNCSNYDLCDLCYLKREHNPSHSFKRIEPPISKEIDLSSLSGSSNQEDTMNIGTVCDGCNFPDIRDVRYKCINCYNYNLCDFCYRGNIHDLSHRFSRIDTPNGPRTDLPPRLTSRTNQAQGLVHEGIQCDECKSLDILGIRYKCKSCRNYDLCDPCYRGNAHDLSHSFIRIDSPNCVGIYLPPRLVTMTKQKLGTVHKNIECNACHYINIRGIRYKCKDCRDYDLCVFCYHGNKHDLSHRFSRIDSLNCVGIDFIPRSTSRSNQKQDSVHRCIQCDECNIFNIRGIRYKCNICRNYDLCERCYNANKHDVHHNFKRLDCPNSVGVVLPPLITSRRDNGAEDIRHKDILCNKCSSADIHGMRYKCNNCHDYDLCNICYHGDKHNLNHSFTRIETPHSNGIYLPPRLISKKCQLRGIFKDARVVPGIDWARDSQNRDQPGIVLGITRWNNNDSWRSAAYVKWEDGSVQLCRLGYKGHCDIQLVGAATSSIYYYPEHLPVLGQIMVTEYPHVIQNEHVSDTLNETAINSRMIENTLEDSEDTPVCSNVTTSDERLKQLENKIMEMEESQICAICMENKRDMVFLCGHGTCSTCANSLVSCHICRKTIQMKIRIY